MLNDDLLFVEKYRPQTIEECILPNQLKSTLLEYVSAERIPNLMFFGTAGSGKTTAAKALCNETNSDCLVINGSDEGRMIDTLRTKLTSYCSTVSMSGNRKVVIIDEADYMNPDSVQPAMRGFIEKFANNCSFIFTCNYKNRIIEPIHSRCATIDFTLKKDDKPKIAAQFMSRVQHILDVENITYDKKVLAQLIQKYFPDFRRTINELQRYSVSGSIDSGILANIGEMNINALIQSLKEKNFPSMRKWVVQNIDNDAATIFRMVYENLFTSLEKSSIPQAIVILADYQYKAAFAADMELNLVACLIELMSECEFV